MAPAVEPEPVLEPEPDTALGAESELEAEVAVAPETLPEPLATDVEPDPFDAPATEDDPWAPAAESSESIFGAPADGGAESVDAWSTASEDAWADAPPPPPPPPPGLDVDDAAWADAPPPPPPPPPDFDAPGEAAPASATFGGLSGPATPAATPELGDPEGDDNPWLAELDQDPDADEGHRSRFGRRR
jgi:hypothetical protein